MAAAARLLVRQRKYDKAVEIVEKERDLHFESQNWSAIHRVNFFFEKSSLYSTANMYRFFNTADLKPQDPVSSINLALKMERFSFSIAYKTQNWFHFMGTTTTCV